MSYQVIARKWRPQAFEEVTGQEPITRTLRNAIEHDRLHHAYLFSGARGVGKTTTARLLAKALNCHKSDKPIVTPCAFTDPQACPSCREIAEGRSIDVLEIDAASNTGVDNVRESIINTVGVRPARDRYKVFIIDEVHMLSGAAFNALLKTLEEPPPRVVFIMATTELHKVPDTILSRCQQFEFRTIPAPKIADRLRKIADAENVNIHDEALREIARAGDGSMRDAQSAFDQVISFSGGEITTKDVEAALGLAGTELLRRTMRAVAEQKPADLIAVVEDLVMRGHDLRNFTRDLLAYARDLLIARVGGESAHTATEADATLDKETLDLATNFSESDLTRFFHSLTATERDLRDGAHPRYQLEVGLIKLVEMGRLAHLDDVLRRLGELEGRLRGDAPSATSSGGSSTPPAAAGGGNITPRRAGNTATGTPRAAFTPNPAPPASSASQSASPVAPPNMQHSASAVSTPSVSAPSVGAPPLKLVSPSTRIAENGGVNSNANEVVHPSSFAQPTLAGEPDEPAYGFPDFDPAQAEPSPPVAGSAANHIERIKTELENRRRAFVAVALEEAQRVSLEADELCVEFSPKTKHLRDNLTRPENIKALREACHAVTGRELGLKIVVRDPAEASADSEPLDERAREKLKVDEERAELWRIAEAHPAIQEFKRIFRGEIIDVWREPTDGRRNGEA